MLQGSERVPVMAVRIEAVADGFSQHVSLSTSKRPACAYC
jgi:hypothetical protein